MSRLPLLPPCGRRGWKDEGKQGSGRGTPARPKNSTPVRAKGAQERGWSEGKSGRQDAATFHRTLTTLPLRGVRVGDVGAS